MRLPGVPLFALLLWIPVAGAEEKSKPITPEEAAKNVDKEVTLQMPVKAGRTGKSNCFLNSEEDFKDPKNFTVFIGPEALKKFKEAKIDDPAAHFKGKMVQVKGKVTLYRERPQIALTGPEQIKIVEKEKKEKEKK